MSVDSLTLGSRHIDSAEMARPAPTADLRTLGRGRFRLRWLLPLVFVAGYIATLARFEDSAAEYTARSCLLLRVAVAIEPATPGYATLLGHSRNILLGLLRQILLDFRVP